MTRLDYVLLILWAHLNGAGLAYAIVDDSHGRPYPDRPILFVAEVLFVVVLVRYIRRNS